MNFLTRLFGRKYIGHPEAVIISCFFNPMNSPYRLSAFNQFYASIRHLNNSIIECVIGDSQPQLKANPNILRIRTENLLWHKEAILNLIIANLPKQFKYVFWVDADVLFSNRNWLAEGVTQLQANKLIQPFEYCVHLDQDEYRPAFKVDDFRATASDPNLRHKQLWRSFAANCTTPALRESLNYDRHGHVGFAWGARREILDQLPLYDRALIGGADHIIAHAAAGQIPHPCITNSFTEDLENVVQWSKKFHALVNKRIGYVKGDLYHLWHGDINKRQYLRRIREFTPRTRSIQDRDENGLYVTGTGDDAYVQDYFQQREVSPNTDDAFLTSMALGYMTDSTIAGGLMGGDLMGAMVGSSLRDQEAPAPVEPPPPETNAAPALVDGPPILLENEETPAPAAESKSDNFS